MIAFMQFIRSHGKQYNLFLAELLGSIAHTDIPEYTRIPGDIAGMYFVYSSAVPTSFTMSAPCSEVVNVRVGRTFISLLLHDLYDNTKECVCSLLPVPLLTAINCLANVMGWLIPHDLGAVGSALKQAVAPAGSNRHCNKYIRSILLQYRCSYFPVCFVLLYFSYSYPCFRMPL